MLKTTIQFIVQELNAYYRLRYAASGDLVASVNLVNQEKTVLGQYENKILASLVHLEEERVKRDRGNYVRTEDSFSRLLPPVNMNFYLLFSANFNTPNYPEALEYLGALIGFFQSRPVFTAAEYPFLEGFTEKITLDIVNLDMQTQTNLWNMLGVRYMPSMLYRVRTLIIQEGKPANAGPLISGLK